MKSNELKGKKMCINQLIRFIVYFFGSISSFKNNILFGVRTFSFLLLHNCAEPPARNPPSQTHAQEAFRLSLTRENRSHTCKVEQFKLLMRNKCARNACVLRSHARAPHSLRSQAISKKQTTPNNFITMAAEASTSTPTLPYKWTQTLQDVSVTIPIDGKIAGKDLIVEIKKEHLLVKIKAGNKIIVDGDLHKPIKANDSFWTIGMNIIVILFSFRSFLFLCFFLHH